MKSLLIIRTPFQAWLAQQVLVKEGIATFDLIYFTRHDSAEDRYYYNKLSSQARESGYYSYKHKVPSVFASMLLKWKSKKWYNYETYDKILFASLNNLYITSLIKNYSTAELITFDDGTANIFTDGIYFKEPAPKRKLLYKHLFNALSLEETKLRIKRHYTMYQGMPNIVDPNRIFFIKNIMHRPIELSRKQEPKTYFIGGPFEEILNKEQRERLTHTLSQFNIDVYVKHPREREKINCAAPYLDKKGKIAEEAIISDAQNKKIILIGGFSTVMLNMGNFCSKRIVLLAKDASNKDQLVSLCEQIGCEVVLF